MDRRTFLRSSAGLAAAVVLPFEVTAATPSPEKLDAQAHALARRALTMPSTDAAHAACSHFRTVEDALLTIPHTHQRRSLHRTAALDALTAGRTLRWCGRDGSAFLWEAEDQARAVDDGPLLARVWLERAAAERHQLAHDAPSPVALQLVVAALDKAGTAKLQCALRASARFRLAWEFAAEGDERGALMELDAATIEAERAGKPPSEFYDDGWPALRSGTTLRRLGRYAEAEATLTHALSGPPIRTTAALSDLARVHAAQGDVDAAAARLEEAFLLARAHGIVGRQYRILATRQSLPECSAARQLDAVMYGG